MGEEALGQLCEAVAGLGGVGFEGESPDEVESVVGPAVRHGGGAAEDPELLGDASLGPARSVALDDQQPRVDGQAGITVLHRGPPVVGGRVRHTYPAPEALPRSTRHAAANNIQGHDS